MVERKYSLNEDIFNQIDTPEKAYWLGFIAADGCITLNSYGKPYRLEIGLARTDEDHLLKFAKFMNYNGPIYRRTTNNKKRPQLSGFEGSTIIISSNKLCSTLGKHGIHPRKSLSYTPWSGPHYLLGSYWRGVFDGDGHISYSKCKVNSVKPKIELCGTYETVKGFSDFIGETSTGFVATPKQLGKIWVIRYSCIASTQSVISKLNNFDNFTLDRKTKVIKYILNLTVNYKTVFKGLTKDDMMFLFQKNPDWNDICKQFGWNRTSLNSKLRSVGIDFRGNKCISTITD